MLVHGFPLALPHRWARNHARQREERGDKVIEIVRVKITEAGRRGLQ
jgi:hypothetical protein